MAKHLLVVLTNAVGKEREAEFNEWYTKQHITDVVKVPSFVFATRYVAAETGAPAPAWKYLAIYEVECDDVAQAAARLNEIASDPKKMPVSDSLDLKGAFLGYYTPIPGAAAQAN